MALSPTQMKHTIPEQAKILLSTTNGQEVARAIRENLAGSISNLDGRGWDALVFLLDAWRYGYAHLISEAIQAENIPGSTTGEEEHARGKRKHAAAE